MFNSIVQKFNNLDKKIKNILHIGLKFSYIVSILALILLIFTYFHPSILLADISMSIFRLGLFFAIEFIICAFAMDVIKNGM